MACVLDIDIEPQDFGFLLTPNTYAGAVFLEDYFEDDFDQRLVGGAVIVQHEEHAEFLYAAEDDGVCAR